jgi:hypothetical protein
MIQDSVENLESLGLDAARAIARPDGVETVEVVVGVDYFERAAYDFSFLINSGRLRQGIGLVPIRLGQRLQDELLARGDEHHPTIHLLDRADWASKCQNRRLNCSRSRAFSPLPNPPNRRISWRCLWSGRGTE